MAEVVKVDIVADDRRFTPEVNKAAAALTKFQAVSGRASQSVTDLSRIVQDAPLGFIGISNNLNPLIEGFGRLRAETGSVGGAFKALAGQLLGPAGIGLAVSLASSALVLFGDRLFGSGEKAKEADNKLKRYKDTVNGIFEASAKEATQVNSLIAVLNNEVETRQRKLAALEELKKINPEIFNGLVLEGNAVKGLDQAYQAYIANLRNVIAAKILQAQLEAKLTELLKEQGATQSRNEKNLENALRSITAARANSLKQLGDQGVRAAETIQSIQDNQDKIKSDKIQTLNADINDLVKRLTELSKTIKIDPLKTDKSIEEVDKLTKKITKVAPIIKKEFLTNLPGGISGLLGLNLQPPSGEIIRFARDFSDQLNEFFQNSAVDIGVAFGETLGQAIAGQASLGDFFKNIFSVIGAGLKQLGATLLAASITIKSIKEFLLKNPVVAIASSIALIAIGSLIQATTSRNAFATGTRNAPGGLALVGERGAELVNLPQGSRVTPAAQTAAALNGMGDSIRVYGVFRGRDIYFSNKRYGQSFNTTT